MKSLEDLATRIGVDRFCVGGVLKLAPLAPAIVETLLTNNEPANLSLHDLRGRLSPLWQDQHKLLGQPV